MRNFEKKIRNPSKIVGYVISLLVFVSPQMTGPMPLFVYLYFV